MTDDGWKPVAGFETRYRVHRDGRVQRLHDPNPGRLVSPGHRVVYLSTGSEEESRYASRWTLVEEAHGPGVAPPRRNGCRQHPQARTDPLAGPITGPRTCWCWPRIVETLTGGPQPIEVLSRAIYGSRSERDRRTTVVLMGDLCRVGHPYHGGPYLVRVKWGTYALAALERPGPSSRVRAEGALGYQPLTVDQLAERIGFSRGAAQRILVEFRRRYPGRFGRAVAPRTLWPSPSRPCKWYWLGEKAGRKAASA